MHRNSVRCTAFRRPVDVRSTAFRRAVTISLLIPAFAFLSAKCLAQPQDIVAAYNQAEAKRKAKTVSYSEYHRALLEIAATAPHDNMTTEELHAYARATKHAAMATDPDAALAMLDKPCFNQLGPKEASDIHSARAYAYYQKKDYARMEEELGNVDMREGEPHSVMVCYSLRLSRLGDVKDADGYLAVLGQVIDSDIAWRYAKSEFNRVLKTVSQGLPVDQLTPEQKKRAASLFERGAIKAATRAANDLSVIFRTLMLQYREAAK